MNILLSIKPKYANRILAGHKKYEFRKRPMKTEDVVYIYSSSPVKKIVGKFEVGVVIKGSPLKLWRVLRNVSGLDSANDFFSYYEAKKFGYAMEILKLRIFKEEIILPRGTKPPRSFCPLLEKLQIYLENKLN